LDRIEEKAMLEYIVVFAIVAAAAIYAAARLWRQSRGRGCENCCCPEKDRRNGTLIQIDSSREGNQSPL
jgi:hypothetical protein